MLNIQILAIGFMLWFIIIQLEKIKVILKKKNTRKAKK